MLWRVNKDIQNVPFLIYMNKSDKEDKMTPEYITEYLLIDKLLAARQVKT